MGHMISKSDFYTIRLNVWWFTYISFVDDKNEKLFRPYLFDYLQNKLFDGPHDFQVGAGFLRPDTRRTSIRHQVYWGPEFPRLQTLRLLENNRLYAVQLLNSYKEYSSYMIHWMFHVYPVLLFEPFFRFLAVSNQTYRGPKFPRLKTLKLLEKNNQLLADE